MIPRIIHYCWFGRGPLPDLALKCIASWKKYCPEYEIRQWNETNFDINCCNYVKEAYQKNKWAFVSDYARFWVLYNFGGIYFDTDVELIRPINDLIEKGPFMGSEINFDGKTLLDGKRIPTNIGINPGLGIAAYKGMKAYGEILNLYGNLRFINKNGDNNETTVVTYTTEVLRKYPIECHTDNSLQVGGIKVYTKEFFAPIDYDTGSMLITKNTRSIHHYASSWMDEEDVMNAHIFQSYKQKYGKRVGKLLAYIITFRKRAKKRGVLKAFLAK